MEPKLKTKNNEAKEKREDKNESTPELMATVTDKVGQGVQGVMIVSERIIDMIMRTYKNIFVIDKEIGKGFYKDKAFKMFDKGEYEKAVEFFHKTIDEGEGASVDVLFYLASAYVNLEKYNDAIIYFRKAEKIDPEDNDIIMEIAACLVKLEEYQDAIEYLEKIILQIPDVSENYYLLGTSYEKSGNMQKGIESYKKAIELDPRDSVYYHALGFAYETDGKHNDAIACFKKAMELEKKG
ncbi:MAG: tetratricopeptide repeat protein [Candidatus Omnitrophica bacterium]|nr:tetratricopeptide repeat protein [Candidatus Omnitrophota bacterium]